MKYLFIIVCVFYCQLSAGQGLSDVADSAEVVNNAPVNIITADSLATGNYKDVLSSFFQIAFNNLTGPNKELNFVATPYAIMLRHNPDLKKYEQYRKTQLARRFNISFSLKADSAFRFGGFSSGVTYAIVNRRDYTLSEKFIREVANNKNYQVATNAYNCLADKIKSQSVNKGWDTLYDTIIANTAADFFKKYPLISEDSFGKLSAQYKAYRKALDQNIFVYQYTMNELAKKVLSASDLENLESREQARFQTEKDNILNKMNEPLKALDALYNKKKTESYISMNREMTNSPINKYSEAFKTFINAIENDTLDYIRERMAANDTLTLNQRTRISSYDKIVQNYGNKLLWTASFSDTTYNDGLLFKDLKFSSKVLKGFGDDTSTLHYELEANGFIAASNDSLREGRNLKRCLTGGDFAFNLVIRGVKTNQSYLECKVGASYFRVLNNDLYKDEERDIFTFNGTIRLRVFDEIWIPIDIKYDPSNGNVFGYFNVKTNFKALGGLFSKS